MLAHERLDRGVGFSIIVEFLSVSAPPSLSARKLATRGFLRAIRGLSIPRRLSESSWRRTRLAILCYHGVSQEDEHEWDPRYFITPGLLDERMRFLRDEGYSVLPFGEGLARLQQGSLPPKSVAITFDDGCYDFYRLARPILGRYGFPATVYLTTFYCYHHRPVFAMFCRYLLWKARGTYAGTPLLDLDFIPDLRSEDGRTRAAAAIFQSVDRRRLPLADQDAVAEELAGQLGLDYRALVANRMLQIMRPGEVAQASAEGWDIQLHTHRHRTPAARDLFMREILDNRRAIREMTGSDAHTRHFCYPSGLYSLEFLPWLAEQGVVSATTCDSGLADPPAHPLLLPRIVDHSGLSPEEMDSWLTGFSDLLRLRRRTSPAEARS